METFNGSEDLLSLAGAQFVMGKSRTRRQGESDEQYGKVPMVPGIFIPVEPNGIDVRLDSRKAEYANASGNRAFLGVSIYPIRQDSPLLAKERRDLAAKGEMETSYNVTSREVYLSINSDKRKALIERYKSAVIRQHPEWAALDFDQRDANNQYVYKDFRAAVLRFIPRSIGLLRTNEPTEASPVAAQPMPMTSVPSQPTTLNNQPETHNINPQPTTLNSNQEISPIDDLPF